MQSGSETIPSHSQSVRSPSAASATLAAGLHCHRAPLSCFVGKTRTISPADLVYPRSAEFMLCSRLPSSSKAARYDDAWGLSRLSCPRHRTPVTHPVIPVTSATDQLLTDLDIYNDLMPQQRTRCCPADYLHGRSHWISTFPGRSSTRLGQNQMSQ